MGSKRARQYGDNAINVIDDVPTDAIMPRLVKLLPHLNHEEPGETWHRYLLR